MLYADDVQTPGNHLCPLALHIVKRATFKDGPSDHSFPMTAETAWGSWATADPDVEVNEDGVGQGLRPSIQMENFQTWLAIFYSVLWNSSF